MMVRYILFFVCLCAFSVSNVLADSKFSTDRDEPLEITADASLEWHRNELYFSASKNVRVMRGDTVLASDEMIAKYRDGEDGGIDVYAVQSDGNVEITSAKSKAYGDKAIYSIDRGYAIMTGDSLRMVSDDQVVTARDSFKYWVDKGQLEAAGDAVVLRAGDKIAADKIVAVFTENASGKRVLKIMEAVGNVVITTQSEVLTGERSTYDAVTNIAELHGGVKITRGDNVLKGKRASVNMNTNVSNIVGGASSNGRVRGVFYPDAVKSGE